MSEERGAARGTVEERLVAAENRLARLDIESVYGYLYDSKQGDAWATLFT